MKQKYLILKGDENKELIIKEFAELDKDMLTLICEETYDYEAIESAIAQGKDALVSKLRTINMYPPSFYADKIAESIMDIWGSEDNQSMELFFDDIDFVKKEQVERLSLSDIEEEAVEIDELLEDTIDEDFDENKALNKINSSIKIADDEVLDIEEES